MEPLHHLQRTPYSYVILLVLFSWFFQSVNCICENVTTSDSILWLQSNRRCQWIATTAATSWTSNMNYCVSQGGYLAHVYNSVDRSNILSWKAASSKGSQVVHIGLYKDSSVILTTYDDRNNSHWYLSTSTTLPFYLVYQYLSFIDDWGYALNVLLAKIGSIQQFTIQADEQMTFSLGNAYAICEQSTSLMKAVYLAYPGYTSPAMVWLSQPGMPTRRSCARYCANLQYCMGFNAVVISSTSITCQYIAERTVDTGSSLVTNANSVYYELSV